MEQLTLLLEDSLANPTQAPESVKAKKMSATYGLRCLEQYERLPRVSSWAKMFAASLIGMEGWYSRRCALSWKVMGIKSRPLLYLRARSTPHIVENGSGLLPTPRTADIEGGCVNDVQIENGNYYRINKNGVRWGVKLRDVVENGLLPTPMAQIRETTIEQTIERQKKYGGKTRAMYLENFAVMGMLPTPTAGEHKANKTYDKRYQAKSGLTAMAANGMLPTPNAFDWNTAQHQDKYQERKKMQMEKGVSLHYSLRQMTMDINPTGTTSQLNPRFVGEMMGFPANWTELPFLSGETKV
jgi:hypothetical protein